jgi:hypothetical protein
LGDLDFSLSPATALSSKHFAAVLFAGDVVFPRIVRGSLEFLLDVCMFANANGGTLLIGVLELRDTEGQPTGTPDPSAELGIVCANPEQQLLAYESRSLEAIDERLPIELRAVPCASGRHLIGVRVPNSLSKPHRVRYQGRTYFPSRRERQRYELVASEIKDMAMRTASQSERAEAILSSAIGDPGHLGTASPVLVVALLPVFFRNFVVDLKQQAVSHALTIFTLPGGRSVIPEYSVNGLSRIGPLRRQTHIRTQRFVETSGSHRWHCSGGCWREVLSSASSPTALICLNSPARIGFNWFF